MLLQNRVLVRIVQRPERLLADVDAVERRLREKHVAVGDELRQMPIYKRQQERRDVIAVRVGVGQDDQLAVAQLAQIEVLAEAAAERRHEIRQLFVFEHLRERHALGVQHFAAQRQNRLPRPIAPLLRGPARRIAFHDEELAAVAGRIRAVAQLAR